jgi:hypothetical protein
MVMTGIVSDLINSMRAVVEDTSYRSRRQENAGIRCGRNENAFTEAL